MTERSCNYLKKYQTCMVSIMGWSYIGVFSLWIGLRILWFDQVWWLALLNTLAFYLCLPIVVLIPIAIFTRRWRLLIGLLIPTLAFGLFFGRLLSPKRSMTQSTTSVTVMSFNAQGKNDNFDQIASAIHQANPDIVGFQEVRPKNMPGLSATLLDYPYTAIHKDDNYHTVALASRFPIVTVNDLPNPAIERGIEAVIDVDGTLITVLVTHLVPNNMPLWPPTTFVSATQQRYRTRMIEVQQIKRIVETRQNPLLMLCDCNMTDTSETYAVLDQVLTDSFQTAGWGLRHTLRVNEIPVPVQRVDFVWHSEEFQASQAYVGAEGGSDHLPAIATLHMTQPPSP